MSLARSTVLVFLISLAAAFLGKNYVPDSLVTWASTSFIDNARGVVIFIATLVADIFLVILYVPAKMYFEEQRVYTWDEVNFSIDSDPIFGYGIRIKSDKDIKEIGREVKAFWKGQTKLFANETPVELFTLKEDKHMLTKVKKGVYKSSRMFPVVNCNDGKAWLVTSENEEECLFIDKGQYYIEVAFSGMINGRKLDEYVFSGSVDFNGKAVSFKKARKKR